MPVNHNILSSCGRTIAIPELLSAIIHLVGTQAKTLNVLRLICHHWKNHIDPWRWRTFRSLNDIVNSKYVRLLQRYGRHIQSLESYTIKEATLRLISDNCVQNLMSLTLSTRNSSYWTSYRAFERFLIALRPAPLTSIYIDFDLIHFDPTFFWSLSQLPRLQNLSLRTYTSMEYTSPHHLPTLFISFLECCPTLKTFNFWYKFYLGTWYRTPYPKGVVGRLAKAWFTSKHDRAPTNINEVFARRVQDHHSTIKGVSRTSSNQSEIANQQHLPPKEYQLRHLDFDDEIVDIPALHQIIVKSPYLEELDLVRANIDLETLAILSSNCPQLGILRVCYDSITQHGPRAIQDLVLSLPRIHTLNLIEPFTTSNLGFPIFDTDMQQYENRHGKRFPLKCLKVSGHHKMSFKLFVDTMVQCSVGFESLVFDWGRNFGDFMLRALHEPSISPDWTLPIYCQDTLENLTMTTIAFPHKSTTARFFSRLQGFTRLKSLRISLQHLRELITNPVNEDIASPMIASVDEANEGRSDLTLNFCFPSVQVLRIPYVYMLPSKALSDPIRFYEGRLAVTSCPSLVEFDLWSIVGAVNMTDMVNQLGSTFPNLNIRY